MTMPIEREAILPRINGIRENLVKLGAIRDQGLAVLQEQGPEFDLAQHYLRLTLEGVFNITGHILSRLPGGRATEYKEMARKLGAHGIVDRTFAEERLVPMAGRDAKSPRASLQRDQSETPPRCSCPSSR